MTRRAVVGAVEDAVDRLTRLEDVLGGLLAYRRFLEEPLRRDELLDLENADIVCLEGF